MTDEDIEFLTACNYGSDIENPFRGSSLSNVGSQIEDNHDEDDIRTWDLTEMTPEEKLLDLDLDLPIDE